MLVVVVMSGVLEAKHTERKDAPMKILFLLLVFGGLMAQLCSRANCADDATSEAAADIRCPSPSEPLPVAVPVRGNQHLGFVAHWSCRPEIPEDYVASGSTSIMMNLLCWGMRDKDKQLVDFRPAEGLLRMLYKTGLNSTVIIDTSVHHSSIEWRSEITKGLGQNLCGIGGAQSSFASPFSPKYREMVQQYIEDTTRWFIENDKEHRVTAYTNGAEVFMPGLLDYGPLATQAFRAWLIKRYGTLDAVNKRWGSGFETIEQIDPPPFYRFGHAMAAPDTFVYGDWNDGAWAASCDGVKPGFEYKATVEIKAEDVLDNMAAIHLFWPAEKRDDALDMMSVVGNTSGEWQTLTVTAKAPRWAKKCDLLLGLKGPGKVLWRKPSVVELFSGKEMLTNPALEAESKKPRGWSQSLWHGKLDFELNEEEKALSISSAPVPCPYDRPSAAWYDFDTFSMEALAELMEHWSIEIKEKDPSRQVMHYLGFNLGLLSQWDDLSLTQRPDIFLKNAPSADINGLQLCAGKGDFHYATVVLDLARKYGKPMVATDLQDFTHGLYVGFNSLNRTTLACIAHGMSGSYFYCWQDGSPDYSWAPTWPAEDTARLIHNASKLIDFFEGTSIETPIAFLLPIQPYAQGDPGGQKSDMLDSMGWYKAIQQAGFCVDIYTPYELENSKESPLGKYKIVIVPDCPILPRGAAEAISSFVGKGGTLILGGRPPAVDETGVPLSPSFLPDGYTQTNRNTCRGEVKKIPFMQDSEGLFSLRASPSVLDPHGKCPGISSQKVGDGTLTWTASNVGRAYLGPVRRYRVAGNTPPLYLPDGDWSWPREDGLPLLAWIQDVAAKSGITPCPRLDPPDPKVEMVVRRGVNELKIALIHTGTGMHWKGRLILPGPRTTPPDVQADFQNRLVKVTSLASGECSLDLPAFSDSCLIRW